MHVDPDYKPSESDVKTVMEAHGLLPEGPLLEEALGLTLLYVDIIRQVLEKFPDSVDRRKAVLSVIEEGLMEDGIIPSKNKKKFETAFLEGLLIREGIIPESRSVVVLLADLKGTEPRK